MKTSTILVSVEMPVPTPKQIRTYLEQHGWIFVDSDNFWSRFLRKDSAHFVYHVCLNADDHSYAFKCERLMADLENMEYRCSGEILKEILSLKE